MKTRLNFVSNSSSSSFIISKDKLTDLQIMMIKDHIEMAQKIKEVNPDLDLGYIDEREAWTIEEDENNIKGYTYMDNFDMEEFLTNVVKVNQNDIEWDTY